MNEQFYTILTNLGLAAFANAPVLNRQVVFSKIAVGDSNGSYYTPTKDMTSLRNKVWEGNVSSISIDEENANWIIVEAIIPSNVGGFTIREVGIYDDDDNLLGIGKMPETFKPELAQGSSKDLYIKVIFEVTNASSVVLRNDPSVIIATKKYVDEQIVLKVQPLEQKITNIQQSISNVDSRLTTHLDDNIRHLDYATAIGTNTYTATFDGVKALVEGMSIKVKFTNANTEASTLNINGLGAKSIQKGNGNTLSSGNIKAGQILHLVYTGSNFQVLGEGGEYGTATASDVLSGKTVGTENGLITGAIPSKSAQTFTPGISDQTIPSGQYLSGTQTILGDADLVPNNIISGVNIFGVVGTAIEGKRVATGSLTSSTLRTYNVGSSGTADYFEVAVSGLAFRPSLVLVYGDTSVNAGFGERTVVRYKDPIGRYSSSTVRTIMSNAGATGFIKDSSYNTFTSNGFSVPFYPAFAGATSVAVNWVAIEQ